MFPEPEYLPTSASKVTVNLSVPIHVLLQLGNPIRLIGLGNRPMVRAAMPKATIDEDCYLSPREGNVKVDHFPGGQSYRIVLPEAETTPM